jgi:hypothetical protein
MTGQLELHGSVNAIVAHCMGDDAAAKQRGRVTAWQMLLDLNRAEQVRQGYLDACSHLHQAHRPLPSTDMGAGEPGSDGQQALAAAFISLAEQGRSRDAERLLQLVDKLTRCGGMWAGLTRVVCALSLLSLGPTSGSDSITCDAFAPLYPRCHLAIPATPQPARLLVNRGCISLQRSAGRLGPGGAAAWLDCWRSWGWTIAPHGARGHPGPASQLGGQQPTQCWARRAWRVQPAAAARRCAGKRRCSRRGCCPPQLAARLRRGAAERRRPARREQRRQQCARGMRCSCRQCGWPQHALHAVCFDGRSRHAPAAPGGYCGADGGSGSRQLVYGTGYSRRLRWSWRRAAT